MSVTSLELEIIAEARYVTDRPKLRAKDLLAWRTTEMTGVDGPRDGEIQVHLPSLGIWAILPASDAKR